MSKTPRIALVTPDEDFTRRVRSVAERLSARVVHVAADADNAALGISAAIANQPDLVVLGPELTVLHAQEWTELLDEGHPTITTLWVVEPVPSNWRRALRSGARDLIDPGSSDDEIESSLRQALATHDRRYAAPGSAAQTLKPADIAGGRVITVASPKGGSGKTMLSSNIAYGLHDAGKSTVLVDLDLQFGDIASALHLRPEFSVMNALKAVGDPTAVKAFLTPHPGGMFVLAAPTNPADADAVDPDALGKLLDLLRNEFDYVIVDTGAGIDESTLVAIEQATDVAFVTSTDLAAIQALRKAVVVLDQLKLNDHRRWYILNRADARVGLSRHDIEESTGLSIDLSIPSSRIVPMAMNQGLTILEEDDRSTVGRAIGDAVHLFMTGEEAKDSTGLMGRLFRRGQS